MTPTYEFIKESCEAVDISINELCKLAEIDRSKIQRWKTKEPECIVHLRKITGVLDTLRQQKEQFQSRFEVVYISGKVTGDIPGAIVRFGQCEAYLRAKGYS